MALVYPKDPDSDMDYGCDWDASPADGGPWLNSGATIATSVWTVPAGITNVEDSNTTTVTKILLRGGSAVLGTEYEIVNYITTSDSPVLKPYRTLTIRMGRNKGGEWHYLS